MPGIDAGSHARSTVVPDDVREVVRRHGAEQERDGRLHPRVVDTLRESGLYRLAVPRALGGLEAEPPAVLELVEALAAVDSAVGWNVNQAQAGSFMASRLGEDGLERLFGSGRPPVFAGAAFPPCALTPVERGFEVSGTVRFLSGCHDADWVFVIGLVPPAAAGGHPEARVVFVEQAAVEVLDTWHVMGMRATGSCDVRLDRVVVADELTASMVARPSPQPAFTGACYRLFPWTVIAGEAAVSVGIARAAVDLVVSMAASTVRAGSTGPIAERESVQAAVGRSRALVEAARATLHLALDRAWSMVRDGRELGPDEKVSLQLAVCLAADHGARAVDLLHEAVGTAGFVDTVGLERHFRDVHVLTQHGTKSAMRFASAGRVMLGLPSDTPILA